MKSILIILGLTLSFTAFADADFNHMENTYEQAKLPNFLPYVGKALPGRCYFTADNKAIASVLMVSFEDEGYEVAPFDVDKKKEDVFDRMTYADILKVYPVIKKMFVELNETADGAVIYRTQGQNEFRGEIRESAKYMIMRDFFNDKLYKFCNYAKRK